MADGERDAPRTDWSETLQLLGMLQLREGWVRR